MTNIEPTCTKTCGSLMIDLIKAGEPSSLPCISPCSSTMNLPPTFINHWDRPHWSFTPSGSGTPENWTVGIRYSVPSDWSVSILMGSLRRCYIISLVCYEGTNYGISLICYWGISLIWLNAINIIMIILEILIMIAIIIHNDGIVISMRTGILPRLRWTWL